MMVMKTIEVVAAIIHQNNKILATQRGYGDYKGWWEFPGGKMEEGETEEQAIIREIREELDVEIAVERKVCPAANSAASRRPSRHKGDS